MNLQTPPEVADGGYWYVTPAVPDPNHGGVTPGDIPGAGWCAWYGVVDGVNYAVVRCPQAVTGLASSTVATPDVLASTATKPYGRVGGA